MPTINDSSDCRGSNGNSGDMSRDMWADAKRMLRNRRTPQPGLPLTVILLTYREQLCGEGRRVAVLDGATSAHIAIQDGDALEQGGATLIVRDITNEFNVPVESAYLEVDGQEFSSSPWDGHPMRLALPPWDASASRWILRFCKDLST